MAEMASNNITLGLLDVFLLLHTDKDPQTPEWQSYIDLQIQSLKKTGGDITKCRTFVITDGGAPNAKQRQQLADAFGGSPTKFAVISHSLSNPIKRGIVTAFTWVNPSFKAVMPEQWAEALKHLGLENYLQQILLEFGRLQSRVAPNKSLALFLASSKGQFA
jgi:hypothetical protein